MRRGKIQAGLYQAVSQVRKLQRGSGQIEQIQQVTGANAEHFPTLKTPQGIHLIRQRMFSYDCRLGLG